MSQTEAPLRELQRLILVDLAGTYDRIGHLKFTEEYIANYLQEQQQPNDDVTSIEETLIQYNQSKAPKPARRGRPKGSKNKPKGDK